MPTSSAARKWAGLHSRKISDYGQALTGLRVLKFYGAIAPRVLKFDSGFAAEGCGGRLIDKPLWGLRVDGPLGRRFLRGLSLTRLWREGCCRAPLNYRRRLFMIKPLQPPCGRGKCIPLWWLAPLCRSTIESIMRRLPFRALLSHRFAGGRWCPKAPKGGKPPEVAHHRNAYQTI